jgi:hypothetical protein
MIFDEYQSPMQVWRLVASTSGYTDPVWTQMPGITGRIEPVNAEEQMLHQQSTGNLMEMMLSPITYRNSILPGDGIVDIYGIQRKVAGYPEVWGWMMPHIATRLMRTQWDVTT